MSHTRSAALREELLREAATTRRVLERVPEDHLAWRPHPRSMSLGQLALHIALLPDAITALVTPAVIELPTVPLEEATIVARILAVHDAGVSVGADRLAGWDDAAMAEAWTMTAAGEPILTMPRGQMLRSVLLNHTYHHRGQLTVYLRMLEVPLPDVYGPTADEGFAVAEPA